MSAEAAGSASNGRRRVKRVRGVQETLLSIVLGMEVAVLFFAALVLFGLKVLDMVPAFVAGGIAMVLVALLAGLQRHRWAVWAGGIVQIGLIALGLLLPALALVGVGFGLFWLWCFRRGRQIEKEQAAWSASLGTGPAAEGEAP